MKKKYIIFILVISCMLIFSGCGKQSSISTSLFFWELESSTDNTDKLRKANEVNATRIYQQILDKQDINIKSFLKTAQDNKLDIYSLCGDPGWIIHPENLENAIKQATHYQSFGIKGIVVDVEPYLLEDFENNGQRYMDAYVSMLEKGYQQAKEQNLDFIICIPYYFDQMGYSKQLHKIIEHCDEIAIMNYNKHDEFGQIKTELNLAKDKGKAVSVIYEMQEIGKYELTENNTYIVKGIAGVQKSFKRLIEKSGMDIGLAYHGL